MAIIKQYNADTDTTYVYESTSYWDPEKGQSRAVRKCIGKIDPATGEIVPTGKRGRKKKEAVPALNQEEVDKYKALFLQAKQECADLTVKNNDLQAQVRSLTEKNEKLTSMIRKISDFIEEV